MTACRNKASRAVTAALVGVLSVGAVPMVAMAAGVNDGAVPMAVENQEAFEKAKASAAVTNDGAAITDLDEITVADGTDQYPIITELSLGEGLGSIDVSDTNKYQASYGRFLSNGSTANIGDPDSFAWETGHYYVDITALTGAEYTGTCRVEFWVVANELSDAVIYNADGTDLANSTFTYKYKVGDNAGYAQSFGFALDGKAITGDVTVKWFVQGTDDELAAQPSTPGKYTAQIFGNVGTVWEGKSTKIDFTINKLNLANADVKMAEAGEAIETTTSDTMPTQISIDGEIVNLGNWFSAELEQGAWTTEDYKTYTFDVSVVAGSNGENYLEGTTKVSVDRVQTKLWSQNIQYVVSTGNNAAFGAHDISADLSVTDPANPLSERYDQSKVVAYKNDGTRIDAKYLTFTYKNADTGAEATEADMQTAGNWLVGVKVDPAKTGNEMGSDTQWMRINVVNGSIDYDATLYFTYKGVVADGTITKYYTGTDYLANIDAVLKSGDKTLVKGEDYQMKAYESVDGKWVEVDAITDAGTYKVEVTADGYNVTGVNTVDVIVKPVVVSTVYPVSDDLLDFGGHKFFHYTGEEIAAPGLAFESIDEDGNVIDGEYTTLPADSYVIDHYVYSETDDFAKTEDVKVVKEVGFYKAALRNVRGVTNYLLTAKESEAFEVSDARIFADVNVTDWYASYVYEAADLGYMTGYGANDGKFFGPTDTIKRGDVAMVLWNMAGQPQLDESGDWYSDQFGFVTGFEDVDGKAYYAQAIAWAKRLGIVSGDDNADTFRPEDSVTREELAKMLTVYSEKVGKDVTVDTDAVLSEYEDESTVSEWARDYVAYLVDQDVMGQDSGLKATDPISRAEVATMAVRLQPEHLDIELVPRS